MYARIDVEAAAQDHVLGAVDDEDEAVVVHDGRRRRCGRSRRTSSTLGGRLGLVPVALHHVRAAGCRARRARRAARRCAGPSRSSDLDHRCRGSRHAARTGLAHAVRRREGAGRRGFGHAPAFVQRAAGQLLEPLRHLERQRRAARAAVLERAQVVAWPTSGWSSSAVNIVGTPGNTVIAWPRCRAARPRASKRSMQHQLGAERRCRTAC